MNWYRKILNTFGLGKTLDEAAPTCGVDTNYSSMKVAELKAIAKERGIKGYYKLKKAELVYTLSDNVSNL